MQYPSWLSATLIHEGIAQFLYTALTQKHPEALKTVLLRLVMYLKLQLSPRVFEESVITSLIL